MAMTPLHSVLWDVKQRIENDKKLSKLRNMPTKIFLLMARCRQTPLLTRLLLRKKPPAQL